ncbi:MAG: tryptophan--tRNA ligase [Firmicutes bacterium]|nr:tryptophan--tRNA ligase [Bacillota bacterium]MBR3750070.1 tryptophan--tRNA ligase [Bacillota bacterium]MBR4142438.1 tryptophan--tRNA ligase [Bacillota bacterium]MBR6969783.1 tryptophan--tRNA ligase [Bacillota bacterium]
MKRVFSGVQPTGNLHIGNYLGALKQFVELQDDHECIYCVVDMHSITVPQDPKELKSHTLDIAALYMAVGIDPKKSIIFAQSTVPGHAELNWILTCNSYTGELSRMTQYKQKSHGAESAPTGLFMYPVLMAADILLYDTDIVPVGNDQKQHIELTRDLAIRINNKYGETFVVPEGRFMKAGARVMALDDPTSKMSKSAPNEMSRISLLDEPNKIKKAIMRSTTDSEGVIRFDIENKPGISNLLSIYSAFSGKTVEQLEKDYEGSGYGQFKKDLVEVAVDALTPIRERFNEIRNSQELLDVMKDGAERANAIAEPVVKRAKERFGLGI